MNMYQRSMPCNSHNINVVRRLAKEKCYELRKVRNEDYFDLFDKQSNAYQFRHTQLDDIYDFLVSIDS